MARWWWWQKEKSERAEEAVSDAGRGPPSTLAQLGVTSHPRSSPREQKVAQINPTDTKRIIAFDK